jgi:hypothetical protein
MEDDRETGDNANQRVHATAHPPRMTRDGRPENERVPKEME